MKQLASHLWFVDQAEEAATFYCSIIPNSRIVEVQHFQMPSEQDFGGSVKVVRFELDGHPYLGMDGGEHQEHTDAFSIYVLTDDQAETDRIWDALLADGGKPVQCGWLIDRYGVRWQVTPAELEELMTSDDTEAAARAAAEMVTQVKIDIDAIRAAHEGR